MKVTSTTRTVPWGWPELAGGCAALILIIAANALLIFGIIKLVRWAWEY